MLSGSYCRAVAAGSAAVAVGEAGDRLVETLSPMVRNLKVGPAGSRGSEMGPLVTGPHRDRVRGYIDRGVEEGAELVVDGGFGAG